MSSNFITNWSEMTLNCWRIVERCPKPNGVVGSLIRGREIFSLLMDILARWPCATYVPPKKTSLFIHILFITTPHSVVNTIGRTYVFIQGLLESTNIHFR